MSTVANAPAPAAPTALPVVASLACDGADLTTMVHALEAIGLSPRPQASADAWIESARRGTESCDLVALVGRGERVASLRLVARVLNTAPDSRVVVGLLEATADHVADAVNQGACGVALLPATVDRVMAQLRPVAERACAETPARRASARHRRNLTTLSAGEVEVLEGMLSGLANKQTAQQLGIGLRTVELRRSKIMRKMGARSLAQLISFVCFARGADEERLERRAAGD